MKNSVIFILFLLFSNFSSAQIARLEVQKELDIIYSDFTKKDSELKKEYLEKYTSLFKDKNKKSSVDSLYAIDYKKYWQELRPYQIEKIDQLKDLLMKLDTENPLLGRITVYIKDNPEDVQKMERLKNTPEYSDYEFIGILTNQERDLLVDEEKIQSIRKDFLDNFDSSYFADSGSSTLSAKISFILDEDGYFKRIKPVEGNEEFVYFCAISMYGMRKKYEPNSYKGKPILTRYSLPIKMKFE